MQLTDKEKQDVAALADSEGWRIVQDHFKVVLTSQTRRLTVEQFNDLAQVTRLQGEITGIARVLDFVNNRVPGNERS